MSVHLILGLKCMLVVQLSVSGLTLQFKNRVYCVYGCSLLHTTTENAKNQTVCLSVVDSCTHVLPDPILLVAWHSGRMSICDRRDFPVLCLTCSWRVTTYVGKPSATRSANWANFAFHPFKVDKWVVSCNRMCATSLGWCHLVNAYGV